ncbi:MAG TPA: tetratricopeptide repeat protein [Flavobacterium sp.]|jgi:hypothetical protein
MTLLVRFACSIYCFILWNCSNNNNSNNGEAEVDRILKKASNTQLSYKIRKEQNDKAYSILLKTRNCLWKQEKACKIANIYLYLNEYHLAYGIAQRIQKDAQASNNTIHLGRAYTIIGRYHMYQSRNDSAYYYFRKTKLIFSLKGEADDLIDSYINLAQLHFYIGDFFESKKDALAALDLANKIKDLRRQYLATTWLAISNTALEDYEESIQIHKAAMKLAQEYANQSDYATDLATSLYNIGNNYFYLEKFSLAIQYYTEAKAVLLLPQVYPELYCLIEDNLLYSKFMDGRKMDILYGLKASATIRKKYNVIQGSNFNNLYISHYYLKNGEYSMSRKFAQHALAISYEFNSTRDILETIKQLCKMDTTAVFFSNYISINDSLTLTERRSRNKFAQIEYETEQITHERNVALTHKNIALSSGIGGVVFGLLLLTVRMQKNRRKELLFTQEQQRTNELIYQLIHDQQIKVEEARQSEKQRVAEELQVGITNRLKTTRLNLLSLAKTRNPETIQKCLSYISDIQSIEKEIRAVAHRLNTDEFVNVSFAKTLENLFLDNMLGLSAKIHPTIDTSIKWEFIDSNISIHSCGFFKRRSKTQ